MYHLLTSVVSRVECERSHLAASRPEEADMRVRLAMRVAPGARKVDQKLEKGVPDILLFC